MPLCIGGCNGYAEVYFCVGCAMGSGYVARRARADHAVMPTATKLSRNRQLRIEQGAAYEEWIDLQSTTSKIITARCAAVDPRFTLAEWEKLRSLEPARVGSTGDYVSAKRRKAERKERRQREQKHRIQMMRAEKRAAREWWISFLGEWGAIGWVIVDELTKPERACVA